MMKKNRCPLGNLRSLCGLRRQMEIITYLIANSAFQKCMKFGLIKAVTTIWKVTFQRWIPRGRPWPRGHILKSIGLGLEASSPWPWPRSLRSSKIALSSARGQHYFLNRWNFVGKRPKPRGKFANTFFVFRNWSIGLAKRASSLLKFYQWQKCDRKAYCFFSFSFFLAFFAYTSSEQQYWRPGAPRPPQINFCQPI